MSIITEKKHDHLDFNHCNITKHIDYHIKCNVCNYNHCHDCKHICEWCDHSKKPYLQCPGCNIVTNCEGKSVCIDCISINVSNNNIILYCNTCDEFIMNKKKQTDIINVI